MNDSVEFIKNKYGLNGQPQTNTSAVFDIKAGSAGATDFIKKKYGLTGETTAPIYESKPVSTPAVTPVQDPTADISVKMNELMVKPQWDANDKASADIIKSEFTKKMPRTRDNFTAYQNFLGKYDEENNKLVAALRSGMYGFAKGSGIESALKGISAVKPVSDALGYDVQQNNAEYEAKKAGTVSKSPIANTAGNIAGNLALMLAMPQPAALKAKLGDSVVKSAAKRGLSNALAYGASDLIQNAGEAAVGSMGAEDIAKSAGTSAAGGIVGGIIGDLAGTGIGKFLANKKLMTPFADFAKNGISSSVSAVGNIMTNYALTPDEKKPNRQELASQIGTAFLFAWIESAVSTGARTAQAKQMYDSQLRQMQNEYGKLLNGQYTEEAYNNAKAYTEQLRKNINSTYFAGGQSYVNDVLDALDEIDRRLDIVKAGNSAVNTPFSRADVPAAPVVNVPAVNYGGTEQPATQAASTGDIATKAAQSAVAGAQASNMAGSDIKAVNETPEPETSSIRPVMSREEQYKAYVDQLKTSMDPNTESFPDLTEEDAARAIEEVISGAVEPNQNTVVQAADENVRPAEVMQTEVMPANTLDSQGVMNNETPEAMALPTAEQIKENGNEKRNDLNSTGSIGDVSRRAGESAGELVEGAGQTGEEWRASAADPGIREKDSGVRRVREVEASSICPKAEPGLKVYEVEGETPAIKAAKDLFEGRKVNTVIYSGPMKLASGREVLAGVNLNTRTVFIQADHANATAEVSGMHESCELAEADGWIRFDDYSRPMINTVGETALNAIVTAYGGTKEAFGEFVCDVNAGKNQIRRIAEGTGREEAILLADAVDDIIAEVKPLINKDISDAREKSAASAEESAGNRYSVEIKENGEKKTKIKSEYKGTVPVDSKQRREKVTLTSEEIKDAKKLYDIANEKSISGEKSFKNALREGFEDVFRSQFEENPNVEIDGVSFGGEPYVVTVSNKAFKKIINDKVPSEEKFAVLTKLREVIKTSNFVGSGDFIKTSERKENNPYAIRYDYFEKDVKAGKEDYTVTFDVEVYKDRNNFRTYKVMKEINLSSNSYADSAPIADAPGTNSGSKRIIGEDEKDVKKDSSGRELSRGQQEYFKNSEIRDENGNLLTLYHGTPSGNFTAFKDWAYLTPSKEYAERYMNPSASSIRSGKKVDNPKVYEVYANSEKLFDTRKPEDRKLYMSEFYRKYGNGTPLMESGLPDWTDGEDLIEFFEDNGYDYDGIILDEGADGGYGDDVKKRGFSYMVKGSSQIKNVDNLNPTKDKDIRFSMELPVEESDRLIALHNMNEEALESALDLGGLAMPSFAVMRSGKVQNGYGKISVVASKDSIDPKKGSNIYGGDAWTPVFPEVNYKASEKALEGIEKRIADILKDEPWYKTDARMRVALDSANIEEQLSTKGSFRNIYKDYSDVMKIAFLKDTGRDYDVPMREKWYIAGNSKFDAELMKKISDAIDPTEALNVPSTELVSTYGDTVKKLLYEWAKEKYKNDKIVNAVYSPDNEISFAEVERILRSARKYLRDVEKGTLEEVDTKKLGDDLKEIFDEKTQNEFNSWLDELGKDIIEKKGIRNNVDLFTPSGNRRSFEALHYDYNLANVIRVMKAQPKQGRTQFMSGPGSAKGAMLESYKSIEDVRKDLGRLGFTEESAKEAYDSFHEHMEEVSRMISDDLFDGSNAIAEGFSKTKTRAGIESYLRREWLGWGKVTEDNISDIVDEMMDLKEEANKLPMEYFEAKLYRAYPLNEALAVIAPDTTSEKLMKRLQDEGVNVITYRDGDSADRIEKINSVEGSRFSSEISAENMPKPTQSTRELRTELQREFSIPAGRRFQVNAEINSLAEKMLKNGAVTNEDREELFRILSENGAVIIESNDYDARAIKNFLKNTTIYIPKSVREELGDDYMSFFGKLHAAGVKFTQSPTRGIDTLSMEINEMFGANMIDVESGDETEMLREIVDYYDRAKPATISLDEEAFMNGEEGASEYWDSKLKKFDAALEKFGEKAGLEMQMRSQDKAHEKKIREYYRNMISKQSEKRKIAERNTQTLRDIKRLRKKMGANDQKLADALSKLSPEDRAIAEDIITNVDENVKKLTVHSVRKADLIAAFYEDAVINDPNYIPDKQTLEYYENIDKKKISEMSLDELAEAHRILTQINTHIDNLGKEIGERRKAELEDVYNTVSGEIRKSPVKPVSKSRPLAKAQEFFDEKQLTPMNYIEMLDGWKQGVLYDRFARQYEEGERAAKQIEVDIERMIKPFTDKHKDWIPKADGMGKGSKWYKVTAPKFAGFDLDGNAIYGPDIEIEFTPAMKVELARSIRNPDNLRHAMGGVKFPDKELYQQGRRKEAYARGKLVRMSPETMKRLFAYDTLDEVEKELFALGDRVFDDYSKKKINETSQMVDGIDKAIGGHYSKIYSDRSFLANDLTIDESISGIGSLQSRNGAKNAMYAMSIFDAFDDNKRTVKKYAGLYIPLHNMQSLLNFRSGEESMKNMLANARGQQAVDYIQNMIRNMSNPKVKERNALTMITDTALNNYVTGVFGFNPGIVLKQWWSYPSVAAVLGFDTIPSPKQVAQVDTDLIDRYTPELAYRDLGWATPELAELKKNPNFTQKNRVTRFIFGGAIQGMDYFTVKSIWPWAENYVKKTTDLEPGTDEFYTEVAKRFNEAVGLTQPMYDEAHRADIMKDRNPITRAVTMFKTVPVQQYNMIRKAAGEYVDGGKNKDALKKIMGTIAALLISNIGLEATNYLNDLWKNKGKNYADEEGNAFSVAAGMKVAKDAVSDFVKTFIGGQQLVEAFDYMTGQSKYLDNLETPGIEQINAVTEDFKDFFDATKKLVSETSGLSSEELKQYVNERGQSYLGTVKSLATEIALVSAGIPISNIEKYLIGTLQWVAPGVSEQYKMLWDSTNKRDLSGLTGSALTARVKKYMGMRIDADEETVTELSRLYESTGTEVIPGDAPTDHTVDGEKIKYTMSERQRYENAYKEVAQEVNTLVKDQYYKSASDADRAAMVTYLYNMASKKAGEAVNGNTNSTTRTFDALKNAGVSAAEYATIMYKVKSSASRIVKLKAVKEHNLSEKSLKAVIEIVDEKAQNYVGKIGAREYLDLIVDTEGMKQDGKIEYIKSKTSDRDLQKIYFEAVGGQLDSKKNGETIKDGNFNSKFGYASGKSAGSLAAPGKSSGVKQLAAPGKNSKTTTRSAKKLVDPRELTSRQKFYGEGTSKVERREGLGYGPGAAVDDMRAMFAEIKGANLSTEEKADRVVEYIEGNIDGISLQGALRVINTANKYPGKIPKSVVQSVFMKMAPEDKRAYIEENWKPEYSKIAEGTPDGALDDIILKYWDENEEQ